MIFDTECVVKNNPDGAERKILTETLENELAAYKCLDSHYYDVELRGQFIMRHSSQESARNPSHQDAAKKKVGK
jgi:hypothetical protein